ncbi:hypothetical protein V2I01_17310 [Micromonospora sp. BRA006-A]|nr:hypothetical protein [Micromonospora sp. BRA006-A]
MKYMLLIWNRPGFVEELSEAERTAVFGEVDEIMKELTESGELVGGEALAHPRRPVRPVRPPVAASRSPTGRSWRARSSSPAT